jgi:hypothetical protein
VASARQAIGSMFWVAGPTFLALFRHTHTIAVKVKPV